MTSTRHGRCLHCIGVSIGILLTVASAGRGALATPAIEEACRQQGLVAERLAAARDHGLSMQQAIEIVREQEPSVSRSLLVEVADLLFHQFRRMSQQQVALEFMAACLDEAK